MNLPVLRPQPGLQAAIAPPAGPQGRRDELNLSISAEQKLELLEYWRSIIKRKWMILGLGLAAAVLAAVVAMVLTPEYNATATVLIEANKAKILSVEDVYSVNPQREHYQTQIEVLKSREVAERTVRKLKLWQHPLYDARQAGQSWKSQLQEWAGMGEPAVAATEDQLIRAAVGRLMAATSIEPVRASQLIRVSIEGPDAKLAARIANTLAEEYIDSDRDARFKITQGISGFLQERLSSLRDKLAQSEAALQSYRESKGIVSLAGSAQTLAGQHAGNTTQSLSEARARRLELEGKYQQVKSVANGDYSTLPWVLSDNAVRDARNAQLDARRKLTEATETLGGAHPRVRQLESLLEQAQASLNQLSRNAANSVVRDYEVARSTEQALSVALDQARSAVQNVNREEFQLVALEREVQTNRQLYDMFMNRAKETNLTGDIQASVARVVDAAVPPDSPIKPKRSLILALALLLALMLGALASVVLDQMDNTVKGGEDAEVRLKQPLLAAVPAVEGVNPNRMSRLYLDDPHSHFAEAMRTARTGVLLSALDAPHKTLLITSSLPGEGKTTTAINLALAHAQTKRTLLIDCDMRRSQVSRTMNLPPGLLGLSNLVAGNARPEDCLHEVPDSPLTVLPVGDLPPNPLELLLSQRFKDTLASLKEQFDIIIIDSPPVELVSEALVLAPMVNSTAFVVKAMSTPAPLVRKNLTRLQRAGGHILGIVVNQLDFQHARLYYGEYGASSYSYGGYGAQGQGAPLTYGAPKAGKKPSGAAT